MKTVTILWW